MRNSNPFQITILWYLTKVFISITILYCLGLKIDTIKKEYFMEELIGETVQILNQKTGEIELVEVKYKPIQKNGIIAKGYGRFYFSVFNKFSGSVLKALPSLIKAMNKEQSNIVRWTDVVKYLGYVFNSEIRIKQIKKEMIDNNLIKVENRYFVRINPFYILRNADIEILSNEQIEWDKRYDR